MEGASLAVSRRNVPADRLILAGRPDELAPLQAEFGIEAVEVEPCSEVVAMDESPASAIRTKPDSSIARGMRVVAEGRAGAFVSAGNTGAVVASSAMILGRLPGVSRPGIAVPVPTHQGGPCVVIDVGANIYCKAEHMLQYAVMAGEYCRAVFDRPDPRVGLLNIGEEAGKGNPLIQEVDELLRASDVTYRGFIEGQDIMSGNVDVVVCEGFVGNVILKVTEGLVSFVSKQVHAAFEEHPPRPEVKSSLGKAFQQLDYAEYGGAPLLGVGAPVLIGHGRSSAHALMNMIHAAATALEHDVTRHITDRLAQQPQNPGRSLS
ncbi:MAG: phosphate acyltransferase [Planctomycetota bacterium]|nr:MAG: phosphate acyltransferase [Planctomycetota bacterium]